MKIPAARARRLQLHSRLPKFFRYQMHHAVLDLQRAGDTEKAHGFCQHRVALKYAFPNYRVDETSFVFERHEHHTTRGSRTLPANDETGVANSLAVFHCRYRTRIQ